MLRNAVVFFGIGFQKTKNKKVYIEMELLAPVGCLTNQVAKEEGIA